MTTRRVDRYKGVFTAPPSEVPARDFFDGPLLGNGDVGVVIGGKPEKQQFWLSKCDFWRSMPRYPQFTPVNIGWLDLEIPELRGAKYYAEQVLSTAEVVQTFTTTMRKATITSWTPATENTLMIQISCVGMPFTVHASLNTREAQFATNNVGIADGFEWLMRKFSGDELDWPNEAAVAMKILGDNAETVPTIPATEFGSIVTGTTQQLAVSEDSPAIIALQITTSHETDDPLGDALSKVSQINFQSYTTVYEEHQRCWDAFWRESEIDIGDEFIEKFYYGSYYIMASCSGNTAFPPAIAGNWTSTDNPHWGADYHMNYNHQAPWWGCYTGNHIGVCDPYETPLLQYIDHAKHMASSYLGKKGILFCVGIGPLGSCSCWEKDHHKWDDDSYDKHFFANQKSNASWGGVNMIMRYRATLDPDYARRVYPYLIELANFWEDHLIFEDGRYIVTEDAIHESNSPDVNSVISLGLLRSNLAGTLEMSVDLGVDEARREKWQHILDHLSDYPVYERDGVKVFRYTEVGQDWQDGSCCNGLQHIYPADTIALDSDPELLQIAKNTVTAHNWGWDDFNHTMTYIPCAARIGFDPETILDNIRERSLAPKFALPNFYLKYGGGGIEACSTVTASINEMLLQSCQGPIRVFPNWPKNRDAKFTNLRAYGAFLVSADLKEGVVGTVAILSERGRALTLVNPWPELSVTVTRANGDVSTVEGERFTLETKLGEVLTVRANS